MSLQTIGEMLLSNLGERKSKNSPHFLPKSEAHRRLVEAYSVDFGDDVKQWRLWLKENTDEIIDYEDDEEPSQDPDDQTA